MWALMIWVWWWVGRAILPSPTARPTCRSTSSSSWIFGYTLMPSTKRMFGVAS
jgi:hypothetical protein